jgi:hypothetical protein
MAKVGRPRTGQQGRSLSSELISCNLSPDAAAILRQWAAPINGRIGIIVERLVNMELGRRQERERIRQLQIGVLAALEDGGADGTHA